MAKHSKAELARMSPEEFRIIVRRGEWRGRSEGIRRGYTIANLAIVPEDYAFEFLPLFNRNSRPRSVIDVTDPVIPIPGKWHQREICVLTCLSIFVFKDG
jgi:uncharacterized protein YcsI (UPF0317 family)